MSSMMSRPMKREICRELLDALSQSGNPKTFIILYGALKKDDVYNHTSERIDRNAVLVFLKSVQLQYPSLTEMNCQNVHVNLQQQSEQIYLRENDKIDELCE